MNSVVEEHNSLLTKNRNISRYQTNNLLKIGFLFLDFTIEKKGIKANLYLSFYESLLQMLSYKNVSQTACKILATPRFFMGHLRHETVNEITRRTPSGNPYKQCAH